jgi:ABC-type phosphate/phosphonate transport system substrate-binding protein
MGFAGPGAADSPAADTGGPPLRVVVMDPLSDQLACDCVAGYAQRKYGRLGEFLQKRLARPVQIAYAESLLLPHAKLEGGVDLVIGKFSEVVSDAARVGLDVRSVAMLTGQDGTVTLTGLFVVRQADPAKSIEDLRGYPILFGPEDSLEKRWAALASLEAFGLPIPQEISESPSCNAAALAVVEEEADAAVISSYAVPLLEGCNVVDKGALRVVGDTDPVPFISVFATDRVGPGLEQAVVEALVDVGSDPALLAAMESQNGFVALSAIRRNADEPVTGWTDWRGPNRDAISAYVPQKLPAMKSTMCSAALTPTRADRSGSSFTAPPETWTSPIHPVPTR